MPNELFGAPNGLRAYQDDQVQLATLANQTAQSKSAVALQQAQIANLAADNARLDRDQEAKLQAQRDTLALQAKLAEIAQSAGGSQSSTGGDSGSPGSSPLAGGSPFDKMLRTGVAQVEYLQSVGRLAEAEKLITPLTNGVKDLAQARSAVAEEKVRTLDAIAKKHEGVATIMSGAVDPVSYAAARVQLAGSGLLSKQDLAEVPPSYDPRWVNSVVVGSQAAKQKADLAREAARMQAANANDYDQIANRKLVRGLEERKLELDKTREDRLAKQGEQLDNYRTALLDKKGASKSAPNPREIAAVDAELKRQGLKFSSDVAPSLKTDLVAEVRDRVRTTSMSWGEASAAVIADMTKDGRISPSTWGKDEYKPDGKTQARPVPLPATRAELVPGMYYRDPKSGKVEQFKGFGQK